MSYDNDSISYTLTKNGWVTDRNPSDAIEKWIRSTNQASGWSRELITWTCEWVNSELTRAERDKIRKKHKEFMGVSGRSGDRETKIGDPL